MIMKLRKIMESYYKENYENKAVNDYILGFV